MTLSMTLLVKMLSVIMLDVMLFYSYAECRCLECRLPSVVAPKFELTSIQPWWQWQWLQLRVEWRRFPFWLVAWTIKIFWRSLVTSISEAFTINVLLALALAFAHVISYDRKWCHNWEHHFLMTLEASFTIIMCL